MRQRGGPRPVVVALAAALVVLPVSLLVARWAEQGTWPTTESPASWQMYSATPVPTYTGVDAAGRAVPLDAGTLPPVLRAVGTGRVVPDRLCDADAALVAVRRVGGPQPGTFRC